MIKVDSKLKREIILNNYKNPQNKGFIDNKEYIYSNTNNESCIDEINLMAKIDNNYITDIKFDGEACAICTSSASIMTSLIKEKSLDEINKIYYNLKCMIEGKQYNAEILKEAIAFDDISRQPSRKKCVLLPWLGLEKILKKYNTNFTKEKNDNEIK